eukprot:COSAG02_NODE_2393_length_8966_cov_3.095974_6_plen_214_part_00
MQIVPVALAATVAFVMGSPESALNGAACATMSIAQNSPKYSVISLKCDASRSHRMGNHISHSVHDLDLFFNSGRLARFTAVADRQGSRMGALGLTDEQYIYWGWGQIGSRSVQDLGTRAFGKFAQVLRLSYVCVVHVVMRARGCVACLPRITRTLRRLVLHIPPWKNHTVISKPPTRVSRTRRKSMTLRLGERQPVSGESSHPSRLPSTTRPP